MMKTQWPIFLQWIRRNDFTAYIMSYEAFENGGCHIHLTIKHKDKLEVDAGRIITRYRLNKKNVPQHFIDNEKLIRHIKHRIENAWKTGTLKIKLVDDENAENVFRYACKGIGWGSQIEDALRNAKKGEATEKDIKQLWAHFISMKLNLRRWSVSCNLKHTLDPKMNNSIKNNNIDPIIAYVRIPYSERKFGEIKLEYGIVESGSDEHKLANDLLEKENQENTDINSMAMDALNVD